MTSFCDSYRIIQQTPILLELRKYHGQLLSISLKIKSSMLQFYEVKKRITILNFLCTLALVTPMVHGQQTTPHNGYIRVNGQVLFNALNDGYPNAANKDVEAPNAECLATSGETPILESKNLASKKQKNRKINVPTRDEATKDDPILVWKQEAYEAKEKLEKELSQVDTSFEDVDTFFQSITTAPPPGCGYKLSGFKTTQTRAICQAMDDLANKREIRDSAKCHVSNCSTASYLAVIQILRERKDWESIQDNFTCKAPFPKAYLTYVGSNGLRAFAAEYGLGDTKRISLPGNSSKKAGLLAESFTSGWPKKSDPILLQRDKSKKHTAHAVIFSHFESDDGAIFDGKSDKKITKVCYWSSNLGTKGTANRCEPISYMSFIDAARIKS